ncbi:MAG: YciI family protein [Polyangiaceae bacterium]
MRFMVMHKNDPNTEAGLPPPMELVQKMGAFIGELAETGRFLDGAGLSGSATRTRLTFRGGKCTVKHGPYAGEHELPASTLLLKVKTRDEAIGWAERYGKILGDGELELGKINEPWDIGLMPAPENPPLQMLLIDKSDAATEGAGRSPKQKSDLTRLKTEMTKAGVLVRTIELAPSSRAKRLRFKDRALEVLDGPFAETKELVGGFSVMELTGMEEAIELCKRYADILGGTLEIDVRVVEVPSVS